VDQPSPEKLARKQAVSRRLRPVRYRPCNHGRRGARSRNPMFWSGSRQAEVLAARHRAARGIKKALVVAHIDIADPHTVVLLDLPPLSLAIEEQPGSHPSAAH
jgi:hypothetical protein